MTTEWDGIIVDEHVVMRIQDVPLREGGVPIRFAEYPEPYPGQRDASMDLSESVMDVVVRGWRVVAETHGDKDYRASVYSPTGRLCYQTGPCSSPVIAVALVNSSLVMLRLLTPAATVDP